MSETTTSRDDGLGWRAGLRALMRQVAGAVYAFIATAYLADMLELGAVGFVAIEALLIALATLVVVRVGDGPIWTAALVGPFEALLVLAGFVALPADAADEIPWGLAAGRSAAVAITGVVTALLARRRRRKTLENKTNPESSTDLSADA